MKSSLKGICFKAGKDFSSWIPNIEFFTPVDTICEKKTFKYMDKVGVMKCSPSKAISKIVYKHLLTNVNAAHVARISYISHYIQFLKYSFALHISQEYSISGNVKWIRVSTFQILNCQRSNIIFLF